MSRVLKGDWEDVIDIDVLKKIKTNPLGPRHTPVNHGDVTEIFMERLEQNKVRYEKPKGILSPDELKYVYVVDVKTDSKEYKFSIGFINYNNRQKSLTTIAGERVLVCSNEMYTGTMSDSKRRHTNNVYRDIVDRLDMGITYYKDSFIEHRGKQIERMKNVEFDDTMFASTVLNYHRHSTIGNTHIAEIVKEWDEPTFDYDCESKSMWAFQNATTHVLKRIGDPINRIALQQDTMKYLEEELVRVGA